MYWCVVPDCWQHHSQESQGGHVIEDVRRKGGDVVVQNCPEHKLGLRGKHPKGNSDSVHAPSPISMMRIILNVCIYVFRFF